jgi:hypothetical protein
MKGLGVWIKWYEHLPSKSKALSSNPNSFPQPPKKISKMNG